MSHSPTEIAITDAQREAIVALLKEHLKKLPIDRPMHLANDIAIPEYGNVRNALLRELEYYESDVNWYWPYITTGYVQTLIIERDTFKNCLALILQE